MVDDEKEAYRPLNIDSDYKRLCFLRPKLTGSAEVMCIIGQALLASLGADSGKDAGASRKKKKS